MGGEREFLLSSFGAGVGGDGDGGVFVVLPAALPPRNRNFGIHLRAILLRGSSIGSASLARSARSRGRVVDKQMLYRKILHGLGTPLVQLCHGVVVSRADGRARMCCHATVVAWQHETGVLHPGANPKRSCTVAR